MISIEQQQNLLLAISKKLKKQITTYAIGGTAMMFLGLKNSTIDIDLVFTSTKDRDMFKKAAEEIGYRGMDGVSVYGKKDNIPRMLILKDERIDLFVNNVIYFVFSEAMQKRAAETQQFGENLIIKIANPHDIILLKCATDRLKDKDDARNIINAVKINWNLLIEEAKNQLRLGKERAIFDLGDFLDHLKTQMKVNVPEKVLDELWDLIEKQVKEKQKK